MIALSFSLTNSYRKQSATPMDRTVFWRRWLLSALAYRALGAKQGSTTLDDLFPAGLRQDIGILAFDTMLPDAYADVLAGAPNHKALLDAERAAFGAGNDEVGDWLLKRWNLPASLSQGRPRARQCGRRRKTGSGVNIMRTHGNGMDTGITDLIPIPVSV
jgi:HD-like signal output (HDOD) protein